jgi:hypothetical protein
MYEIFNNETLKENKVETWMKREFYKKSSRTQLSVHRSLSFPSYVSTSILAFKDTHFTASVSRHGFTLCRVIMSVAAFTDAYFTV